jgi:hypothetical protein
MEQQNTPYPPLMRAPLKMRGVFGVAWQLLKRGFWRMFGFSMALEGTFTLLILLLTFSMLSKTGAFEEMSQGLTQFGNMAAQPPFEFDTDFALPAVFAYMGLSWLLSLLYAFLVMPAYSGAVYLEMDQRMEGRSGTLYQLFRYALPIGFKRFYTTFLALLVTQIVAGVAMSMISGVISAVLAFSAMFVFMSPGGNAAGSIIIVVLLLLLMLFLGAAYAAFIAPVYPVAVHEGKRAFDAVFRAFKLAAKRFGRMLSAILLNMLLMLFISLVILVVPALLLAHTIGIMLGVISVISCLLVGVSMPWWAAFTTALYVDASARVDGAAARAAMPPMQPQPVPPMPEGVSQPPMRETPPEWQDTPSAPQEGDWTQYHPDEKRDDRD